MQVSRIKANYPQGTRIRLIFRDDCLNPVPCGATGTVLFVDDMGQIHMKWDSGASLALVVDVDEFEII